MLCRTWPTISRLLSSRYAATSLSSFSLFHATKQLYLGPSMSFAKREREKLKNVIYYSLSIIVLAAGLTFAAIPAYRMFCEQTSLGGLTQRTKDFEKIAKMVFSYNQFFICPKCILGKGEGSADSRAIQCRCSIFNAMEF